VGVFLAMFGTLYGTLEIAPTILRETVLACGRRLPTPNIGVRDPSHSDDDARRMRLLAIGWCAGVALVVLALNFVYQLQVGKDKPAGLTAILIPVNLFTGVFACGLICLLNPWVDRRLPAQHRMPLALAALNLIGGAGFIVVALRGYWDYAGWWAMGVLLGILAVGILAAWVLNLIRSN
jgi:hypothetical protein